MKINAPPCVQPTVTVIKKNKLQTLIAMLAHFKVLWQRVQLRRRYLGLYEVKQVVAALQLHSGSHV